MKSFFVTGVWIVLIGMVGVSCRHRQSGGYATSVTQADGVEEMAWVGDILRAVADMDSASFASLCRYPIFRQYPLHDIEDSVGMARTFTTLVDDSLRNVLMASTLEDWGGVGWRGVTAYSGEYLWCDPAVYAIPYQSAREKMLLDSLLKADLATLPDSLASGWRPEDCMLDSLSGTIYRIDMRDGEDSECRVMVYNNKEKLLETPEQVLYGKLEIQGTASTHVYTIGAPDGTEWAFVFFWCENGRWLSVTSKDGQVVTTTLKRAYWLDLVGQTFSE